MTPTPLRTEIADSWRRVDLAGVDPVAPFPSPAAGPPDPNSALLLSAVPLLDQLEESLRGSDLCTLLVDRDCRLVRRWFDDKRVHDSFDLLHLREGASLLEESIGTNALGTALETRQSSTINGPEHFAEALRAFSCFGEPIRHPLTRRIEGVLGVSVLQRRASPLLSPLISRTVRDIEQRLLDSSRSHERSLLAAFQVANGLHRRAVVAIGENLVLSNQLASDLLSASDVAMLRVLAEDPACHRAAAVDLVLTSGEDVTVAVVGQAGDRGAVLRVEPRTASPTGVTGPTRRTGRTGQFGSALVSGEPGSGRSHRAREIGGERPTTHLGAGAALLDGIDVWARAFTSSRERLGAVVCVDGIDLLPDPLVELIIDSLESAQADRGRPAASLVLTSGPYDELTGRAATLAALCDVREQLEPLRNRRSEIPEIARLMLAEVARDPSVHLTPAAEQALAVQLWPGNLRELRAVIRQAASAVASGGVALTDLPAEYRSLGSVRPLSPRDRAERDVIVMALRRAGGNKLQAARELEMSRTTLYARLRQLRITSY